MRAAFIALTVLCALMTALSAVLKIRRDPKIVKVIYETVGVPLKFFPHLAVCEIAGALGVIVGIWVPRLGVDAVEAVGVGTALPLAHVMEIVRQVEHAAL